MKLTNDIDTIYQFIKGSGLVFGYIVGCTLAIILVLGIAVCSIMGQLQPPKPQKPLAIPGMQYYDAQGNIHNEGSK